MPTHTRNLLLFGLLSATAVITWILARDPRQADASIIPQGTDTRGYSLEEAVLDVTDAEGSLYFQILASRVEHRPESENLALEELEVRYAPESEIRWGLTAATGIMTGDRAIFDLNEVLLLYTANTDNERVTFETSGLRLNAGQSLATTEEAVVFRQGSSEARGVGLNVDLVAEYFELKDDVTVRIDR